MRRQPRAFTLIELPAVRKRGFTLIELLVVITIIVVLMAMLMPAMDKAIYQAQLVVCAGHIKTAAGGATFYTTNNRRYYPYRPTVEMPSTNTSPIGFLNDQDRKQNGIPTDDRLILRTFLQINKVLNCPLDPGEVDIENSQPKTYTYSDYALWFGFHFQGRPGMRKLGDRIEAVNEAGGASAVRNYNLLVSDYSVVHRFQNYGFGTHPDDRDGLNNLTLQDGDSGWAGDIAPFGVHTGVTTDKTIVTLSWWAGGNWGNRGTLDLNFGCQDGSVVRVDHVKFSDADEDRMDYIHTFVTDSNDPGRCVQVPR